MYKETFDGTRNICHAICMSLCHEHTLGGCSKRVSAVLGAFPWMDRRSVGEVRAEAEYLTRRMMLMGRDAYPSYLARNLDGVMKAFNRAYKRRWVATKGRYVRDVMAVNRRLGRVFYLVSSHQKPQPAHRDVQGTVLVDRFWRESLERTDPDLVKAVASYVRANGVRTVQWAMGGPTWLITRVNCRHYLIAMDTATVLGSSVERLRDRYQRKPTGVHRPITDGERYDELLRLRRSVANDCGRIAKKG